MQIKDAKKIGHGQRRLDAGSKTRVFVWPDETIMGNFMNRRDRPYNAWKPLVQKALDMFGVRAESIGWSRTAGCKCGCSPGFVVKGTHRPGFDIHVHLEA